MAVEPIRASEPNEPGGDLPNNDGEPISSGALSTDGESPPQAGAPSESRPSDPPPRRALKLVITVSAGDAEGQRAVLALGSEGCDPVLRVIEPGGMQAALQAAPAFLAEAEARWQRHPQYPAANRAALSTDRPTKAPAPRTTASMSTPPGPSTAPSSPGPGQLTLFAETR